MSARLAAIVTRMFRRSERWRAATLHIMAPLFGWLRGRSSATGLRAPSPDAYASFRDLARAEREHDAWHVESRVGVSAIAVVAPPGGGIEPGTSELARAIAGARLAASNWNFPTGSVAACLLRLNAAAVLLRPPRSSASWRRSATWSERPPRHPNPTVYGALTRATPRYASRVSRRRCSYRRGVAHAGLGSGGVWRLGESAPRQDPRQAADPRARQRHAWQVVGDAIDRGR